jgi:hypothetical protein
MFQQVRKGIEILSDTFENALFYPIPASGSNYDPRNTKCMSACPVKCEAYSSGAVKIFVFLGLE